MGWKLFVAPRSLVTGGLLMVVFTLVFATSAARTGGAASNPWMYGFSHGTALAAGSTVVLAVCGFVQLLRANKRRLGPGTELTAVWDADSVLFGSPVADVRIPLSTIDSVRVLTYWVALRHSGLRAWTLWPRELVPEAELARLSVAEG